MTRVRLEIFIILLLMAVLSTKAQSLFVNNKSGSQTSLTISQIKTITFNANNMVFNKKDGNTDYAMINEVRFMSFSEITKIDTPIRNTAKLNIYPNPVRKTLNIEFVTENANSIINIEVLTIDGRLIYSNKLNNNQTGAHSINASSWLQGLYLLKVRSGNEIITNKIIKN